MIKDALDKIKEYLGGYVREIADYPAVELSSISKDNEDEDNGKILITLTHIEEETVNKPQQPSLVDIDAQGNKIDPVADNIKAAQYTNPDLHLNLYVLISAHHRQYETALTYISYVVKAFQAKNIFNLNGQSLKMGIYQLSFDRNINLWQAIGGRLMPSVMYKLQVLTVQASEIYDKSLVYTLQTNYTRDMSRDGITPEERAELNEKAEKAVTKEEKERYPKIETYVIKRK